MKETIEDLERRRDLLKELIELAKDIPTEDEIEAVQKHLSNLTAIGMADAPSEDWMQAVADHAADLTEIGNSEAVPTEDEMAAVAEHLANLKQIEDLPVPTRMNPDDGFSAAIAKYFNAGGTIEQAEALLSEIEARDDRQASA